MASAAIDIQKRDIVQGKHLDLAISIESNGLCDWLPTCRLLVGFRACATHKGPTVGSYACGAHPPSQIINL